MYTRNMEQDLQHKTCLLNISIDNVFIIYIFLNFCSDTGKQKSYLITHTLQHHAQPW